MISGLRHSKDPDALLCAQALQDVLVDLQRLNDAECLIAQRGQALDQMDTLLRGVVDAITRE
jgi:hypothetical protein